VIDTSHVDLEGEMEIPGSKPTDQAVSDHLSTLDEPVSVTIKRDLKMIGEKFFHVLVPRKSTKLLKDWDLWGPLILCMFMAMMLQSRASLIDKDHTGDGGPEFATFFLIYWVGALIITLNTILLGGTISVFQCMCVLGYCVVPLAVALTLCKVVLIAEQTTGLFVVRCIFVLLAFAWCVFASTAFLVESQPPKRKALVLYPVALFYFVISWLVISHNGQ